MNQSHSTGHHVVIVGAKGMLGRELARQLQLRQRTDNRLRLTLWDRLEIDITNRVAVRDTITSLDPTIIINTAAYTNVDGCEKDVELAMATNGAGPGHLAEVAMSIGATLVHFSTDFVFDGCSTRPYRPDDEARPLSVYGRSKWMGEKAVRDSHARHLIIRTSWLFGVGGRNFVDAILDRVVAEQRLNVVTDQTGRPTYTADLAEATLALLDIGAVGTYHFANSGACSWHDFAVEIVYAAGYSAEVGRMTSDQLDRPARRPAYSVLDTGEYERACHRSISTWQDALGRYLCEKRQMVASQV